MASIQIILTGLSLLTILKETESAIKVTPTVASPAQGTTIRPTCTVTGEAFRGWYGPDGRKIGLVGRKYVETNGNVYTLVIKDVIAEDGGTYECHGNVSSATLDVDVPFSANPPTSQKLILNKKGKIFLGAAGFPLPQYKWKKNGLNLDAENGGHHINWLKDGSLEIPLVKVSDAGRYECEISQGYGSKRIVIQVSVVEPPRIVAGPQTKQNVTAGYNMTFSCMGTGLPTPIITWLDKNGRTVDQSVDKRFVITSSNKEGNVTNTTIGLLTIVGVKPEDKASAFTCKVSNNEGQNTSDLAQITAVYVLPILDKINDVYKNLNDKVILRCVASGGDPKPIVQWTRNGQVLPNQQKNTSQSVMTISNVHLQDMGVYTCEAFNGAKDENNKLIVIRENVVLDVQSGPILNAKSVSRVWSFLGSSAKIVCEFDGNPIPNVTITFNDIIVAADPKRAVYEIKSATNEDFGTYLCSATNVYGSSNHTVQLKQGAVPSTPQHFEVLDQPRCHRFTLLWKKPSNDGGFPVTHYFVTVTEYNTTKEVITKTASEESQGSTYFYESISNLKRNQKYRASIQAVNEVGKGEIREIIVTTKQYCKPNRPSIISPRLKTLKNTYVFLEWKRPSDDGGDPNIRYRVVITNMNNDTIYQNVTYMDATKYRVEGLTPGVRYKFQVFASNKEGESEAAEEFYDVSKNAVVLVLGKGRAHTLSASSLASIICVLVVITKTQLIN